MKEAVVKDSSEVLIIKPILSDNEGLKPKQFKIETPIITVESDTDNHLVDVGTVLLVIAAFYIAKKVIGKYIK